MSVEHVYEVRCDFTHARGEGCEEVSEATGESKAAARFFAEQRGWLIAQENGSDYCPAHRTQEDSLTPGRDQDGAERDRLLAIGGNELALWRLAEGDDRS